MSVPARDSGTGEPPVNPKPKKQDVEQPSTMGGEKPWRDRLPAIIQQLPFWPFNYVPEEPDPNYQLINLNKLKAFTTQDAGINQALIEQDMQFLEYELMRLFRSRDHEAKKHQLKYQRFQIMYLTLAALAGLLGSLQALSFDSNPELMPWFSFGETLIALSATFLATISGRQSPLQRWLHNRQRAEALRREFFRYITRVPPYNSGPEYTQKMLLARRAADINRGVDPQKNLSIEGEA